MKLEAKDKKMLARVQALKLKMKDIESKISDGEEKSIEMSEKVMECTEVMKNMESKLEVYRNNESIAISKLEGIMKEIDNMEANKSRSDKGNV